ncbi:hypothetical protein ABI59_05775 [Acidobacteria bacterium Mor1]|nr:hypothetical protein ABI59_05775 [Acidobacteria bacterium Mor1]
MDENKPEAQPPAGSPAPDAKPEAPEEKPEPKISIDDFFKVQLRVAQVLEVEKIENADKLLKLRIDLGDEQRQLVAGIAKAYTPEQLVGKRIIVVANLKPAKLRGVVSEGMLLAADLDGRPIVASFDDPVPPGTQVR